MTPSAIPGLHPAPTAHAGLIAWVEQIAAMTRPDRVHWCDGSEAEKAEIVADLIAKGTLRELDQTKRPGCYYAASDPKDVARVESRTFICSANQIDAGPTNNWADPVEMRARMQGLFDGCMAVPIACPVSIRDRKDAGQGPADAHQGMKFAPVDAGAPEVSFRA